VTVVEGQIRRVDVEPIHRAATRDHGAGERALPVDWERLAIERPQQLEVDRVRL
jgi:hypothetical protein